eukprot:TRINITY_DN3085_c0_g1_i6.p1 TRINITY_DN3085_c0_g1~~TRINITY_DN3085_c0_g1_i6.p1  ORF type:complete len:142 (-),score=24.51 TRINITY_DN3085_c0_g1_i6:62-487(-)
MCIRDRYYCFENGDYQPDKNYYESACHLNTECQNAFKNAQSVLDGLRNSQVKLGAKTQDLQKFANILNNDLDKKCWVQSYACSHSKFLVDYLIENLGETQNEVAYLENQYILKQNFGKLVETCEIKAKGGNQCLFLSLIHI